MSAFVAFVGRPSQGWGDDRGAGLFEKQVAAILEARCLSCHRGQTARGGLSLETSTQALAGGDSGAAFEPGDAQGSLLVGMITGDEPAMPKEGAKLTAAEVAAIEQWINAGGAWPADRKLIDRGASEPWWSLRPLVRPETPKLDSRWVRTPIDAFVLATLIEKGMTPSREAPRGVLLRRLTFDLHGLPPTPEEIAAFEGDESPDAYERVVARLLASPRYGERWARHWLDIVHYGDTHGYDKDKRRDNAWRYRDWVIDAFNSDLPYKQFVAQQLAGDVLAPGDPAGVIATGFVAAGPWDFVGHVELREGTVEKQKTLALDRDDMVAATMGAFCSVTAHCARCHDHPFDPIPQRDHYQLQAVFAGVARGDVPCPDGETAAEIARREAEQQRLEAERKSLAEQAAALVTPDLAELRHQLAAAEGAIEGWPNEKQPVASPTNGYHSAVEARADATKWVQIDLGHSAPLDVVRLVPARPTDFEDAPGFGFPVRFQVAVCDSADFQAPQVLFETSGDFVNPGDRPAQFDAGGVAARYVRVTATRLWKRTGDFCLALAEVQVESAGQNVAAGAQVTAHDTIDAGRWSTRALVDGFTSRHKVPELTPEVRAALAAAGTDRNREELRTKRNALEQSLGIAAIESEIARLERESETIAQRLEKLAKRDQVYAIHSKTPPAIHVLNRGNVEQPGDEVAPGALSCVSELPATFDLPTDATEGLRRAALAAWIADSRNPLTWRSIANRVWHYHFGRGLVDTPNDFGRNGGTPTHPALLDWLAVELRDGDQSLKSLHRAIVTSAVYRQATAYDEAKAALDGDNSYLWRANRRRLDAEEIRDAVLAASGQLDLVMGGPGFDLFRFKDDHSPIYDHTAPDRPTSNRRSVYRFLVRSVPNPFFEVLDCADPSALTPKRNTTITALQALALMNDSFMLDQARRMAARIEGEAADPRARVVIAVRRCFGRAPDAAETELLARYASEHGLPALCRVLLNANEFVFVD